jgi:hypothetical protein
MKKFQLLGWVLLAFIAFQFSSCDNEPLEGEFIDDSLIFAEEGSLICLVNEQQFISESASGILSNNVLVITASGANGETVILSVENPSSGTFNLVAGLGTPTFGSYSNTNSQDNPYITYAALGGAGEFVITELDDVNLTVSGTFNFIGARPVLDDAGNPIVDGNGNPVVEKVTITEGSLNKVVYTIEGGDGSEENDFFAVVDGQDFIDENLEITQTMVGDVPMLNIVATNAEGAYVRFDIPEDQGVGEFAMFEGVSDGTKLVGIYNPNTGGEDLFARPGTITFTEFGTTTGKLKATFSFTARDPLGIDDTTAEITNGSFIIDYIPNTDPITQSFSAEVDGMMFTGEAIEVVQNTVNDIPLVFISAEDLTILQFMRLSFPENLEVGSYAMSPERLIGTEKIGLFIPDTTDQNNFYSSEGTLQITSYDTITGIIEGTFEFTAADRTGQNTDTYQIMNGAFTIQLNP